MRSNGGEAPKNFSCPGKACLLKLGEMYRDIVLLALTLSYMSELIHHKILKPPIDTVSSH